MEKQVLDFISRFTDSGKRLEVIDAFTTGCCYWFARILYERFSLYAHCEIMYDPIDNHFGCLVGSTVYDITGDVTKGYEWQDWSLYKCVDELETKRIIRDCIKF